MEGTKEYQGDEDWLWVFWTSWTDWTHKSYYIKIYYFPKDGDDSYCSTDDVEQVPSKKDFEDPHADFVWSIPNELLEKLKKCSPGQRYECADLFNVGHDLEWYLEAYPNGKAQQQE